MKYNQKSIDIDTVSGRHSYHDISNELKENIQQTGIQNGACIINVPHTTCSIYFDEYMHDHNYFGDEYLQVDINNVLEKIIPRCTTENQYCCPGPKHIAFGMSFSDPNHPDKEWTMLNTDAHIKASMFGTFSATIIIKNGELQLGQLGKIYFVDWDHNRGRKRKVNLMIFGD